MFWKNIYKQKLLSFIVALSLHILGIFLFQILVNDEDFLQKNINSLDSSNNKIENIKLIDQKDLNKLRTAGVKGGVKDSNRPDLKPQKKLLPTPVPKTPKKSSLSLDQLAADAPIEKPSDKKNEQKTQSGSNGSNSLSQNKLNNIPSSLGNLSQTESAKYLNNTSDEGNSHFYYNSSKGGVIQKSREQENIKRQASNGVTAPPNPVVSKISNFEIRYDRPEGVSEDELNSDEKAYYSFYVRSYKNYFQKIYATYEKVLLQKPLLPRAFDGKHILIGKIDYDENGEIIKIKIVKSSDNDDLHYFFEETLKELTQPNPPKVFTKNQKQFSIYYQLQIN